MEQRRAGKTIREISEELECWDTFIKLWTKDKDELDRIKQEITRIDLLPKIRSMHVQDASLQKIAEILNIHFISVRILFDDYDTIDNRTYVTARKLGMTKEELEDRILDLFLEDKDYVKIGTELGINSTSVARYLRRCIRRRLKNN